MNYQNNFPGGFTGKVDPPTKTYNIVIEGEVEIEAYNHEDAVEQVKELVKDGDIEFTIH